MKPHVVRQGEYLARIAAERGLDPDAIWTHAENRALRERRASPEVLAPGDVIFLPDPPEPRFAISPHTTNRFTARRPKIPVRVRIQEQGEPLPDELCLIEGVGPEELAERTGGDGVLTFEVPLHVERVRVTLPARDRDLEVRVGHLDPIDTAAGLAGRLENLGLLAPGWEHLAERARASRVREALAAFQEARGLAITGALDEGTRAAVAEAHGP